MEAAALKAGETVLEIGPGQGFLTAEMLRRGARVVAVEKDDELIKFLRQKFASEIKTGQLELHHADILNFDLNKLKANSYKLIASLPYYLTGQILRQFLGAKNQPKLLVVLVQKEVAERIVAKEGKESRLSQSIKVYGEPRYIKTVPAGAFSPAPKVDSAILLIDNISREQFTPSGVEGLVVSEKKFFEILKRGFAHKRKLLKNNLECSGETLAACGVGEKARAEDLQLADWLCLSQKVK